MQCVWLIGLECGVCNFQSFEKPSLKVLSFKNQARPNSSYAYLKKKKQNYQQKKHKSLKIYALYL